ncbi:prolyl oligopeptidase family serine peptidase [Gluconobacter cerinus]|uniref:Acyl-peptide hydrolase n=1 Tax=Gluconobacter cerinus TaxID=38307 RepID=A0A1B6VIV1_9PROT|nr:prolyl oligopeptidase family serine peptidase [Gluconobacter cerinus]OAJ67140.1 peptidase S9 [Gluconobacter cerinus]
MKITMPHSRTCALVLSLLSCTSWTAHAQDDASTQSRLSSLMAMPFATDMVGAKHAQRLAWVEQRKGVRNVMISDAGNAPHQATTYVKDDGTPLWGLALTPEGKTLAYVEGGDPEALTAPAPNPDNAAYRPTATVHVVRDGKQNTIAGQGYLPEFSPDGRQLAFAQGGTLLLGATGSSARAVMTTDGTITALRWSPDGTFVALEINRGSHGMLGLWDTKRSVLSFIPPGLGFDRLPTFSPDGKHLAFVRVQQPPLLTRPENGQFWSLHSYDLTSGAEQLLWTPPKGPGSRFWSADDLDLTWTPDGRILFPWEGGGWLRICAISAAGATTPQCLTPEQAEVSSYLLSPDGKSLFYTSNVGELDHWRVWSRPLNGNASAVTDATAEAGSLAMAGDDLAVMVTSTTQTAHPILRHEGQWRVPVTPTLPKGANFVAPQSVQFRSEDGTNIHGQLFLPPTDMHGLHSALVFVHGGPNRQMIPAFNAMGYYSNAYMMNQTLASHGYVVLSVNYRSGTGYGQAFREADKIGSAGASEYQDVRAAAQYLRARPDVASKHIGIWGGSWGGYLVGLALARDSGLFAAGADFHGVHDMTEPDHPGLSPEENRKQHETEWRSSPLADIAHWRAPVLLVHGDDDHDVEFEQSVLLSKALTATDVTHEDHIFPGERHEFLRQQDWLTAYNWTMRFFDRYLKDTEAQ